MKLLILFFTLFSMSCISQEKIDIKGNWYIYYNSSSEDLNYVEVFIDDKMLTYYHENSGVKPPFKYEILVDDIFLVSIDGQEKVNSGKIKMLDSNTFSLTINNYRAIYKRIVEGLTLEKYLFKGNNMHDKYWESFNKRKLEFEKAKQN